jgi:hypothetical protein
LSIDIADLTDLLKKISETDDWTDLSSMDAVQIYLCGAIGRLATKKYPDLFSDT